MKNILFEFDDIAKKLKIPYCLGQGTALGLYRDGKIINGDNDVDIEVFCDNKKLEKLFQKLKESGYDDEKGIAHINIISKDSYEVNQHFHKGPILDILFHFDGKRKKFHKKFDKVKFDGREFNIPHPIEEYLELEFGKNWRKPSDLKSRGMSSLHPYLIGKSIKFEIKNWFKYAK